MERVNRSSEGPEREQPVSFEARTPCRKDITPTDELFLCVGEVAGEHARVSPWRGNI